MESGRTNRSIVDEYFGGDYAKWSLGYPWMLHCGSNRYEDIVGNQALTQYVCKFKHYRKATKQFVQQERHVEQLDGSYDIIPGTLFPRTYLDLLMTQYKISKLFSGPRRDYVGAAREKEFDELQRVLYTGYKCLHGIKAKPYCCQLVFHLSLERCQAGEVTCVFRG